MNREEALATTDCSNAEHGGHRTCVHIEQAMEDLRNQVAVKDAVICGMREALKIVSPAILANLNHFWSAKDVEKFRQLIHGS